MISAVPKVARGAVGVVLLLALALIVRGWWSDYRVAERAAAARDNRPSTEATSTPPTVEGEGDNPDQSSDVPVSSTAAPDDMLTVLIDGLNFRSAPKDDAQAIRGLDKGEKLDLLGERDGWYEVRDTEGATGWVSSNSNYVKTGRR